MEEEGLSHADNMMPDGTIDRRLKWYGTISDKKISCEYQCEDCLEVTIIREPEEEASNGVFHKYILRRTKIESFKNENRNNF